jgi:hypothetical protein
VIAGNQMRLRVSGTNQEYSLGADPKAKVEEGAKPAYERLQEAASKGKKIASVTGASRAGTVCGPRFYSSSNHDPASELR